MTMPSATRGNRDATVLTGLAVLLGCFALFFCYRYFASARRRAMATQADAAELQELSRDIVAAATKPRIASLEVEPAGRISQRVDAALSTAGIPPSKLLSIDPQVPSRLGRTAYRLRLTQIELQELTMKQITRFIAALRDPESGMVVRDFDLSPRTSDSANFESAADDGNPASGEFWDARLTLTQMIFSPISDS